MTVLSCTRVMRYLGRRVRLDGAIPRNFNAEVVMDLKDRPEGMRIKHRINSISLKAYDKAFTAVAQDRALTGIPDSPPRRAQVVRSGQWRA
jgi:hypothetical protein